jgi:GNAT superfamily N-acetyltransferase
MIKVYGVPSHEIFEAANAAELMAEYEAECALPELAPVDPQPAVYEAMEKTGCFRCFGAFAGGHAVGFASVVVYVVPHYNKRIATVESFFLMDKARNGRNGNLLMNAVEDYGRAQSCVLILYTAPAGSQFEKLLRLLKPYRHSNTVFLRTL